MVARNRLRQGHRPEPGHRPGPGGNGATSRRPPTPTARWLAGRLPRLGLHFRRLCAVQVDRLRLAATEASLHWMAGSVVVLTTAAVLSMATILTLLGLTAGLSELLGGRLWLAAVVAGITTLAATLTTVWSGLRWQERRRMARLRRRYEPEHALPVAKANTAPGATPRGQR